MKIFKHIYPIISGYIRSNFLALSFIILLTLIAIVAFFPSIVVNIPAGYQGVFYRPFKGGVDESKVAGEGLHLIMPWNTITQYDSRIQTSSLEIEVLTLDQLMSKVKVSFQFEVNRTTLPLLHRHIGPDYLNKIVIPEVTSITRQIIGNMTSSEAFTQGITQFVKDIAINADQVILDKINPPGLTDIRLVTINAVQLESIKYPEQMQQAIEEKMMQQQKAEAYKYRIQAEKLEADRKVIEATGIKKFQDIVNSSLTDNYLKFKGIEATRKLAESENSKVVIFGNSPGGLPLILGGEPPNNKSFKNKAKQINDNTYGTTTGK